MEIGPAKQAELDMGELLDFALDAASLGVWSLDLITNLAYRSLRHDQCFGYTEAVPVWSYETFLAHILPVDRDHVDACLQKAKAGLGKYEAEFRTIWPDGSVHWLWAKGRLYFDDKGSPCRVAGIVSDITERKLAEERQAQSHELLVNLARLVPSAIYQFRLYPDGRSAFPYANPGITNIYEVTPEEVQEDATPVFERLHPEDAERVGQLILESARTLEEFYCEFRVVLPRQGLRWRWSQAHPIRMADGGTLWHGIISDITESKLTAEALQETQAMLARTEEIGKLGGWEFDIDTRQQTWTQMVYAIHEVDFTDHPTVEQGINFYTPESRPIIEQAVQRAIEHGEPFDLELEIITAKGNLRGVHTIGRHDPVRGKIVGFFQDITERKQAQIATEALRSQLQATLDALPDLLFEVDAEGRYYSYHTHRSDLLAAPPETFMGKRIAEVLPPEAASACQRAIDEAAQNGSSSGETFRLALPQGERWFELSVAPLHSAVKSGQRFIMISRDITESKRAALQLTESESQRLAEMSAALEAQRQSSRAALSLMEDALAARQQAESLSVALNEQLGELRRWEQVTLNRESRILSVKKEINDLLAKHGQPPRYPSVLDERAQE